MHILYIHQHFATPKGTTGTRSYEFARRWVKAGHKVTLITGYYDIGGLDLNKGRKQNIDGIDVVIVGTKYSNNQSYLKRIASFVSFCCLCVFVGLRTKNVDVIFATSTPLTIGIPAMILRWLKGVPYVFEVRDQWPEIPIELGIIKNRMMIRMLLWLEKTIYKHSSAIVALSPGTAEGIKKVLPAPKRIEVIPNSCDTDIFNHCVDGSKIRQEYDWDGKLVLMHFGAMGKVNNLNFVIEAAQRLKDNRNVHFLLAGDGNQKQALSKTINQRAMKNIEILDSIPKDELARFVDACDVSLVIIANNGILEHNSANKFFDSLSAGKPVLLNYSGWQRKILEEKNAGFGCDLCNQEQFIEKILYFERHRDQLRNMGQNARRIAEEEFGREKLAYSVLKLLEEQVK